MVYWSYSDFTRWVNNGSNPEDGSCVLTLVMFDRNLVTLPPDIGLLTNLRTLCLIDDYLTSLPLEIGYLTNLHTLIVSNNNLTTLPHTISYLTKLKTLDLSNNNIPENVLTLSIPDILQYYGSNPFISKTLVLEFDI